MSDVPPAARVLSDAILIAGITACSYAVGYAYRIGFAGHFAVPVDLAAPTTTAVLGAAAGLSGVLLSYFFIANMVWSFTPRHDTAVGRAIRRVVIVGLLFGLMLPVTKLDFGWAILGAVFVVYLCFSSHFPYSRRDTEAVTRRRWRPKKRLNRALINSLFFTTSSWHLGAMLCC